MRLRARNYIFQSNETNFTIQTQGSDFYRSDTFCQTQIRLREIRRQMSTQGIKTVNFDQNIEPRMDRCNVKQICLSNLNEMELEL